MNEMQIFKNEKFGKLHIVERNSEPWFFTKDICDILNLGNPRSSVALLDADEKGVHIMDTPGGRQEVSIVSEPGMYSLVLKSRRPEAKEFKRWITHEVIPSIRKHGAYATPATIDNIINDPDFGIRLLQELKAERDKSAELTAKIEADKPKVEFAEALETSTNSITVKQLSVLLAQRGCDTGEKRLFNELREDGFLLSCGGYHNEPAQRYLDMGLFEVKTSVFTKANGDNCSGRQPRITPKGLQYLMDYYMRKHGKMPLLSTAKRRRV